MHWLRRSPASTRSRSSGRRSARSRARRRTDFCMADSAFSQVFSPKKESGRISSKKSARGPCPSNFPPMLAKERTEGGWARAAVCRPGRLSFMARHLTIGKVLPGSLPGTGKNMRPGAGRTSGQLFGFILEGQAAGVAAVPVSLLPPAAAGAGDDLLRPGWKDGGGVRRALGGLLHL